MLKSSRRPHYLIRTLYVGGGRGEERRGEERRGEERRGEERRGEERREGGISDLILFPLPSSLLQTMFILVLVNGLVCFILAAVFLGYTINIWRKYLSNYNHNTLFFKVCSFSSLVCSPFFSFLQSDFSFLVSRFSFLVSRFSFLVSRSTFFSNRSMTPDF